jgi:hypothetical protein
MSRKLNDRMAFCKRHIKFMPDQNLDFVIDISATADCEKQNIVILKEANDFKRSKLSF